uniref:ATP synthase F0 subunit 8 n=1 Tax=Austrarchaea christopheri TaxID=1028691 RepID=H2E414_9ARAC|nr:ATP synthase F0 subunit 8 [Austrarchaea christopheri]
MPQLSPLFWVFSSFMVVFLLMSMVVIFFVNKVNFKEVVSGEIYMMKWYW